MAAIIPRQRNKFSNNNSLLAPPYVVNVPNWPRFIISTFAPRMPPLCVFHLPVSLCRPMCFDYLCDLTENVPFLSFIIHWFTFVIYFCILINFKIHMYLYFVNIIIFFQNSASNLFLSTISFIFQYFYSKNIKSEYRNRKNILKVNLKIDKTLDY